MKKFNQFREDSLLEVLKASDPTGKWIHDSVHSDNPKFAGKSKKERIRMALGASYASKRNEEVVEKNNHWHDAGKQDAKNGKKPNPRTYLPTLKDKQAKHPEEVYSYMQGYKSVKQGVAEEASPMIKPPSNRFDNKKEAFTHVKTHGGKVFRSTYIDPNTGNKNITFVVKKEQGVAEAKDSREYDYEGDMAKSQLRSIMANAQRVHDMLEDDTNMAEWVQSKITLAADYISTVADYMQSEVKEEVEPIEELNKDTIISYAIRANKDQDNQSTITGKAYLANDPKTANKAHHKFSRRAVGLDRAETRMNKEDTEVAEARMSAAQRLWNAENKQRAKSDASLARMPSSIPKPEEKK